MSKNNEKIDISRKHTQDNRKFRNAKIDLLVDVFANLGDVPYIKMEEFKNIFGLKK